MRATSHTQKKEPLLEYLLSEMRFRKAVKYINNDSIVADLGCGYNGNLLRRVAGKIKIGIGYDVSVTKKGLPKNVTLIKTNLNNSIANRKNYFDVITTLAVLEHIENPESFLRNAKSMLKNKGRIIITTPHKNGKRVLEFLSLKLDLVSKNEILDHKNYFDEKILRRLLTKTGFKIIRLHTFEFGWNLFCVAGKTN